MVTREHSWLDGWVSFGGCSRQADIDLGARSLCLCVLCVRQRAYFWYQSLPPPPPPQSHGSAEEIENEITIIRGAKVARLVSRLAGWLEVVLVLVVQVAELNYCTNDRSRNNAATVCLSVSLCLSAAALYDITKIQTTTTTTTTFSIASQFSLLLSFFLLLLACCCCCTSDVITAMIMSSGGCRGGSGQLLVPKRKGRVLTEK